MSSNGWKPHSYAEAFSISDSWYTRKYERKISKHEIKNAAQKNINMYKYSSVIFFDYNYFAIREYEILLAFLFKIKEHLAALIFSFSKLVNDK